MLHAKSGKMYGCADVVGATKNFYALGCADVVDATKNFYALGCYMQNLEKCMGEGEPPVRSRETPSPPPHPRKELLFSSIPLLGTRSPVYVTARHKTPSI